MQVLSAWTWASCITKVFHYHFLLVSIRQIEAPQVMWYMTINLNILFIARKPLPHIDYIIFNIAFKLLIALFLIFDIWSF